MQHSILSAFAFPLGILLDAIALEAARQNQHGKTKQERKKFALLNASARKVLWTLYSAREQRQ